MSPHAVVADGGALCHSGNLMVATAAKVRTYLLIHVHTHISVSFNTDSHTDFKKNSVAYI